MLDASEKSELIRLREENTRLRAALACSKDPCLYCQLPAEELGKCKAGFPGCARMDDMTGCPNFGAAMEADDLRGLLRRWVNWYDATSLTRGVPKSDCADSAVSILEASREAAKGI